MKAMLVWLSGFSTLAAIIMVFPPDGKNGLVAAICALLAIGALGAAKECDE